MRSSPIGGNAAQVEVALKAALASHRQGDLASAAAGYEAVLAIEGTNPNALCLLGAARRRQGRPDEAEALIRAALATAPSWADAWHNLGNALEDLGRLDEAENAWITAIDRQPGHAEAWYALGRLRTRLDRRGEAEQAYRRALDASPDHLGARHNLANLLADRGQTTDAILLLREVLAARPDLAEAHFNLALALLRQGDYATGFREYEWRWSTPGFPSPRRHTRLPAWDGRPLRGRRLLVHAEQGLGDTIQFARFLEPASTLGGAITFEVPGAIVRLLRGIDGADRIAAHRADPDASPADADASVPLMSLPHRLGLTLGSIPRPAAYLTPETDRADHWRSRIGADGRPVVGVCWRGNPASPVDRGRSLPDPATLAPLAAVGQARLLSLLMLPRDALETHDGPTGWKVAGLPFVIEHPGPELDASVDAFVDTAAVIAGIDMVVTTDTAIAHLAGALGAPTWVMLRQPADWRWLASRGDSPWYPSMQLFRQKEPGEWGGVIGAVALALGRRPNR